MPKAASGERPNVVVIQTDDQSLRSLRGKYRDLQDRIRRTMPKTLDQIAGQGIEFSRYYATNPLCSPSRATLLTGQYSHTSGLRKNSGADGGWTGWQQLPLLNENLPVALQRSGYRTAHVGKFTNNYHGENMQTVDITVPPGWDHWFVPSYGNYLYYYGARLNVNGFATEPAGNGGYDLNGMLGDPPECSTANLMNPAPGVACNHITDRFSRNAVEQILNSGSQPFYLQVDYNTPHGDHRSPIGPQPLSRHYDTAIRTKMTRPDGFNEADVSDKPSFIRSVARMKQSEINNLQSRIRKDIEALRGVDDGVGAIVEALRRVGKLDNTYIIFISDNGMFEGQHRLSSGKFLAYEPSVRVPLLIRGPGIRAGTKNPELSANIDLTPTILGVTGATLPQGVDGRSLQPFWKNLKKRTRRPIVLEGFAGTEDVPVTEAGIAAAARARNYSGIRAGRYKYVHYTNGERELYDLATDPNELNNRIQDPAWRKVANWMARELVARKECHGVACRRATAKTPSPPKNRKLKKSVKSR